LLSWYALFFLLRLFFLPTPAHAQEPGPTTWAWRTFTAENSPLAPGKVNALLEDSQGRIWIETGDGVSLYQDGTWQTFTAEDSPRAPGRFEALLEDSQGRIWIATSYNDGAGTPKGSVSLYHDGAWHSFTTDNSPMAPGWVNALLEDSQGRIWVRTDEGISLYHDGAWQTFTAENSHLAPGEIWELLEDSQSRIWVRTNEGVSLYHDGTWQTFTAENSHLAPGEIWELLEDSQSRIWVRTNEGVSLYHDGTWQTFTAENSNLAPGRVGRLLEDSQGRIWVGTGYLNIGEGLSLYQDGVWKTFTGDNYPLAQDWLKELLEDSWGRIWVRTNRHVVGLYQHGVWQTFTSDNSSMAPGWVNALLEDSRGRIWVRTDEGISLYHYGTWQTLTTENFPLARGEVTEVLEDSRGRIWIGTGDGVSLYHDGTCQTFTAENSSLASGWVRQLLEDSQGRIWVRTKEGVSFHQDGAWQIFTAENSSLASHWVRQLLEDSQGRIWVGTREGISFYQEGDWHTFTSDNFPLAPGRVNVLLEDSQGRIWIGTDEGISFYQAGDWHTFTVDNSPLASGEVNALLEDSQGRIWVGTGDFVTSSGGVSLYQGGIWQTFTAEDSPLVPGWVSKFLEDSQGRIWVTSNGLGFYQDGDWQTFIADASPLAPGWADMLLADSQGRIWFGTWWDGISLYQDGMWYTFTADNSPLAPGMIRQLLEDSQGRVWVGTGDYDTMTGITYGGGVSLYRDGVWQTFNAENSPLAPGEIDVLLEDSQGRIWVRTTEGLSVRHPGDRPCALLRYTGPAAGQTASLWATAALTLTFPSRRSNLVVGFSGIDAESDPDRLLFRCQLLGYDDEEVPCASPVRYTALPPGTYTFRVRTLDEDLMSSEPATATITLISTAPPTPTPIPAPTSTPQVIEVERVVPGLPEEAILTLIGGLGGLAVAIVLGAMIRSRVRRARALRRGFNPYEAGRPILDPDRFFGREPLIAQILNTIHQNDVLIHGERRIGKTSLLRQLEHRLRAMDDPDYQFIPVYADVEGVPQAEFFHLLMEEIVVTCQKAGHTPPDLRFAGKAAADYTYRDFLRDLQSLLEVPQAARHRTIRLILLLDEVDVMNGYDQLVQQQFRRILMKRFAQQVGVVASGVNVFREWSREESPFRNLFVEIHLGTMEEESARRLITEPVKGIYSYDDEAVDLILRYSEHKPWRIQRLCLEVVNRLLAERRTRVTRQDVEEAHRRMLTEEAEWDVPQGKYPALATASLSAAEAEAEYHAQSEEDRNA
jgi:ligand-binding sensor domain-containing protein